ncbi:MAG: 50S ribosomal protein L22 [Candidatus Paceibacterota bacterium]|jgi:large subunit ribosomal protein L22
MLVSAKLSYLRISPRKARLVADLIRGKSVEEAQSILSFTIKRAASPLLKLLNSAAANAKNNFHLDPKELYVAKIWVNEAATYKRVMPRSRGNANEIKKRTCHVDLILAKKGERAEAVQEAEVVAKEDKKQADKPAEEKRAEKKTRSAAKPKKEAAKEKPAKKSKKSKE